MGYPLDACRVPGAAEAVGRREYAFVLMSTPLDYTKPLLLRIVRRPRGRRRSAPPGSPQYPWSWGALTLPQNLLWRRAIPRATRTTLGGGQPLEPLPRATLGAQAQACMIDSNSPCPHAPYLLHTRNAVHPTSTTPAATIRHALSQRIRQSPGTSAGVRAVGPAQPAPHTTDICGLR